MISLFSVRACLKKAFCKMRVTNCGNDFSKFSPYILSPYICQAYILIMKPEKPSTRGLFRNSLFRMGKHQLSAIQIFLKIRIIQWHFMMPRIDSLTLSSLFPKKINALHEFPYRYGLRKIQHNAHTAHSIPGKQNFIFSVVEADRALRMSRGVKHFQHPASQIDLCR